MALMLELHLPLSLPHPTDPGKRRGPEPRDGYDDGDDEHEDRRGGQRERRVIIIDIA